MSTIVMRALYESHTKDGVRAEQCDASWWQGAIQGDRMAEDNDIGRDECRALAARACEAFEAKRVKTKETKTTVKEREVETPDEPDEDPDDDDEDQDDDEDTAARVRPAGDIDARAILSVARAMGLQGAASDAFIRQAILDQAGARPSLASAPARLPSAVIVMGAEDMAQPKAQRAAVAHRSPPDVPPPVVSLGNWSDVAPRGQR